MTDPIETPTGGAPGPGAGLRLVRGKETMSDKLPSALLREPIWVKHRNHCPDCPDEKAHEPCSCLLGSDHRCFFHAVSRGKRLREAREIRDAKRVVAA